MKIPIGSNRKFPLMAEINMIPLIDVSLVLLIIFMVLTPFLVSSQIKINLPKAVSGIAADAKPLKILIHAKKTFYVDGEAVHEQNLSSIVKTKLARDPQTPVLIEADASVPFQWVISAMDSAKAAGAQKLGVAVTAEKTN